ncbi:Hypothetical predicted protein, partial [Marmota monax]
KSHWERDKERGSDANRLERFNAVGDCAITQKMQVNVEEGKELWEAASKPETPIRTVTQHADQGEG